MGKTFFFPPRPPHIEDNDNKVSVIVTYSFLPGHMVPLVETTFPDPPLQPGVSMGLMRLSTHQ